MAIEWTPTQEQRDNTAKRIGAIFGLTDPGMQITRDGVRLESWGNNDKEVLLKVELVAWVNKADAEAILLGLPVKEEQ